MDPLDKLEIIVKAQIKYIKEKREMGQDKRNLAYLDGLQTEIETLEWVWSKIDAIKRNAPTVTDETLDGLYGKERSR